MNGIWKCFFIPFFVFQHLVLFASQKLLNLKLTIKVFFFFFYVYLGHLVEQMAQKIIMVQFVLQTISPIKNTFLRHLVLFFSGNGCFISSQALGLCFQDYN